MIVVSNSSPLIGLSAINLLDLLSSLYETVHIPQAVYEEVVVTGKGRPGSNEVAAATWIKRHTVTDRPAVIQLMNTRRLQVGESEAMILAKELKATRIILDDGSARRYAREQNLPIIGTWGVLLLAKDKKLIHSVRMPMDGLVAAGLYIDPLLYRAILQSAGE